MTSIQPFQGYRSKGDGTSEDGRTIQEALDFAAGRDCYFPPGTNLVSQTCRVHANTRLIFNNTVLKAGAVLPGGIFDVSAANIRVEGQYVYNANSKSTPFMVGNTGCAVFHHDATGAFTNADPSPQLTNYAFKFTNASFLRLGGLITTTGNHPWLVHIDGGAHHHVSGVITPPLTVSNGAFAPVQVCESTGTGSLADVVVTNCSIDGGGVVGGTYPLIMVGTLTGSITSSNITISDCIVKNTTSLSDGIDVILAQYVQVSNCTFAAVNDGINISASTAVKVVNCNATVCHAPGFAVGDPSVTANTTDVSFTNCSAWGNDQSGAGSSQYLVFAPASHTCTDITFRNCYASPLGVSQYAAAIVAGGSFGTVSGVQYEDSVFYAGSVGTIYDPGGGRNAANFRVRNVRGVNPKGFLDLTAVVPAVPASGQSTTVTNNTGYDVMVALFGGTGGVTVYVNQVQYGAALAGAGIYVPLPAGQNISMTYTNLPTWNWFAS